MKSRRIQAVATLLAVTLCGSRVGKAYAGAIEDAQKHNTRGVAHYDAGRFEDAIRELEQACELHPDPILRFNLAQAHRKNGTFDKAVFFYGQYLQMAPNAKNRVRAERWLRESERALQAQREHASAASPSVEQTAVYAPPAVPREPPSAPVAPPAVYLREEPANTTSSVARLRISVEAGAAMPLLGDADDEVPVLPSLNLAVARPIAIGGGTLGLGILGGYSRLPYQVEKKDVNSSLVGLFATAAFRIPLSRSLAIEPALGAGVVWWQGLVLGSPFTQPGFERSGPVAMPSGRLTFAALWLATRLVSLGLVGSVDMSKATDSAMTVSRLTRFGLNGLLGIGI